MKAMIFAAGLGTRLRPLTDSIPKALVPVGGQPLVRHLVERLKEAGYDEFVVNVHHFADKIEDYIRQSDSFGVKIAFSNERARLLDTGGGLLHARKLLENADRFLVHNVDILSNLDFSRLDKYSPESSELLATLVVSDRKTSRYLLFNDSMRLVGWTNVNTGEVRSPYLPAGRTTIAPVEFFADINADTRTLGSEIDGRNADADSSCRKSGPTSVNAPNALTIGGCPELANVTTYAFSGIHKISGGIFPELEKYAGAHGEAFSIIDFYLSVCDRLPIYGFVPENFRMIDVGKLSSLPAAESFLHEHFA